MPKICCVGSRGADALREGRCLFIYLFIQGKCHKLLCNVVSASCLHGIALFITHSLTYSGGFLQLNKQDGD